MQERSSAPAAQPGTTMPGSSDQALPQTTRFWVNWCPPRGPFKKRYDDFETAQAEAVRLANQEAKEIFILQCDLVVRPNISVEVVKLTT